MFKTICTLVALFCCLVAIILGIVKSVPIVWIIYAIIVIITLRYDLVAFVTESSEHSLILLIASIFFLLACFALINFELDLVNMMNSLS